MNGYETDTCFDGDDGLELCLTESYDLILLDLNLPGHRRSGHPAAVPGHLNTTTPVLILSARGRIQDKVEGLDLGANDYLTKALSLRGTGSPDPQPHPAKIYSGRHLPEMRPHHLRYPHTESQCQMTATNFPSPGKKPHCWNISCSTRVVSSAPRN